MKVSKVSGTYDTSGKSDSRRRHCIQEIKAVSSDYIGFKPWGPKPARPPPNYFYAWPRELGKRNNFVGAKRNGLRAYLLVGFLLGFEFSLRTINKILFQTHLLTCKCHPVRFSVITIIESCTSTPTPKLIFTRPRKLGGRKAMVSDMGNKLHVSLFAMVLKCFKKLFKSFAKQSVKILFQTHFLPCKYHPGRFSVINNPSLVELA